MSRMEEDMSALKIIEDIPIGNRPLGKPRPRWEENIRMYLKAMCQCMELG